MILNFIVNGEDTRIEVDPRDLLSVARDEALRVSHSSGRPPVDWQVRDTRGVLLSPDRAINTWDLRDNDRLFLTLGAGIGGTGIAP